MNSALDVVLSLFLAAMFVVLSPLFLIQPPKDRYRAMAGAILMGLLLALLARCVGWPERVPR